MKQTSDCGIAKPLVVACRLACPASSSALVSYPSSGLTTVQARASLWQKREAFRAGPLCPQTHNFPQRFGGIASAAVALPTHQGVNNQMARAFQTKRSQQTATAVSGDRTMLANG